MPLVRIKNGFERLSDANLLGRARFILAQMNGSPHFPTPDPNLPSVLTAVNGFEAAILTARTGNKQDIAVKNQKRDELIDLLHKLGNYVLFTAKEDAVIATSSGFRIARQPEPLPPIEAPQDFQVANGNNPGELEFSTKKVPGARAYLFEYTTDPLTAESAWKTEASTVSKTKVINLQAGIKYWCRVGALGTGQQLMYSNPVARVVQ